MVGQDFLPEEAALVVAALVEDLDAQRVAALVQREAIRAAGNQGGQRHRETGGAVHQRRPGRARRQQASWSETQAVAIVCGVRG